MRKFLYLNNIRVNNYVIVVLVFYADATLAVLLVAIWISSILAIM